MVKGKKSNCSGFSGEKRITCRRCNTKFPVKIGTKNDNHNRIVRCPYCGVDNVFRVDENGKVRGPGA